MINLRTSIYFLVAGKILGKPYILKEEPIEKFRFFRKTNSKLMPYIPKPEGWIWICIFIFLFLIVVWLLDNLISN